MDLYQAFLLYLFNFKISLNLLNIKIIKISDIAKEFNNININTIKKDLQYLKKEKIIKSLGKGKGTIYIIEKQE
ncbi:MAG: hypothetical protein CR986_01910 [Ignavibacteriae bacterium]|nr:MAG: hypothetical protein CR986_01910 [Ignavibacteriota bacterium]